MITKQAAQQSYEAGVVFALADAGLAKESMVKEAFEVLGTEKRAQDPSRGSEMALSMASPFLAGIPGALSEDSSYGGGLVRGMAQNAGMVGGGLGAGLLGMALSKGKLKGKLGIPAALLGALGGAGLGRLAGEGITGYEAPTSA